LRRRGRTPPARVCSEACAHLVGSLSARECEVCAPLECNSCFVIFVLLSVLLCAGPLVWFTRPGALAKGLPSTDAGHRGGVVPRPHRGFASRCFRECGRCVFCSTMRASSGGLALLQEELSSHFSFFDSNLRMPVVSFLARLFELSSPPPGNCCRQERNATNKFFVHLPTACWGHASSQSVFMPLSYRRLF